MDDHELHARLGALRIAIAFALEASSSGPADVNRKTEALRALEDLVPSSAHPAIREELDGIVAALRRIPRHRAEGSREPPRPPPRAAVHGPHPAEELILPPPLRR